MGRGGSAPDTSGPSSRDSEQPSFDQAVETLFTKSFHEIRSSAAVTSGDPDTDRAIDLAVDTLFVEELDVPPPETAELEAAVIKAPPMEPALKDMQISSEQSLREDLRKPSRPMRPQFTPPALPDVEAPSETPDARSLAKLQEAILTLEWEISGRSVKALARELASVREEFRDNVTIDFAALAMGVVLDYVGRRMSRAHPESIRFLLGVTDYLKRNILSTGSDPLFAFHEILTRYDRYKSLVRKAEGIPDSRPAILQELDIENPSAFAALVKAQALMLATAGSSLATKLDSVADPANLIRSFRFLVSRSFNRMLQSTRSKKAEKEERKGTGRTV